VTRVSCATSLSDNLSYFYLEVNVCEGAKSDVYLAKVGFSRAISILGSLSHELPAREPIIHGIIPARENSPRSRIDHINHFVGHRNGHVVAPFHRFGSARPLLIERSLLLGPRTPGGRYNTHRPLAGRCIGLKIIAVFAVVAWRLPS